MRRVNRATAAAKLLADVVALGQEAAGQRRERRNFVRVQRPYQARRDDDQQLGAFLAVGLALEQIADYWQLTQNRQRRDIRLGLVVYQSRDRKRLAVAQFHLGFGAARRQRGDAETLQQDAVVEVERADLGPNVEADEIARDGRLEIQADAELLERHSGARRHASA